jgi:hypothetical protein
MPNWCHNSLTVIGPEEEVAAFDAEHKLYLDDPDVEAIEFERKPGKSEYRYQTRWQPDTLSLKRASRKYLSLIFLLSYMEMYSFRGACVIIRGDWDEMVHRIFRPEGGNEEYDQSHPLVDLFSNYLAAHADMPQPNEIIKVPVVLSDLAQQLHDALMNSHQASTQPQ